MVCLTDQRLDDAISSPAIRGQAVELVRLALLALATLDKVDDSLYARFVATRTGEDSEAAAEGMRNLWGDTFRGQQFLLAYCRKLDAAKRTSTQAIAQSNDLEFDDLEVPVEKAAFELDVSDIGDLVDSLGVQPARSEADRWATALETIAGIRYALGGQYEDATERMEVAISAGHINHVLALLDELTSVANEGIAALVMAVYEAFVPDADAASVLPAYQTTLRRAIMVRRGLASLLAKLTPLNDILQKLEHKAKHPEMASRCADEVRDYVESRTCRAMRAADRWELSQFDQRLQHEKLAEVRLTVEGLVKYLESLNVVNQREVLVQHDRVAADEVREAISTARELAELSAVTTHEIILKACQRSQDLRGRSSVVDPLLEELRVVASGSKPADNLALLDRLEQMLASAGL